MDYIAENMDIPRLKAMGAFWRQFPPLPVMIAHYLGAVTKKPDPVDNEAALAELMTIAPERPRAA
jgi:hypothetical protein